MIIKTMLALALLECEVACLHLRQQQGSGTAPVHELFGFFSFGFFNFGTLIIIAALILAAYLYIRYCWCNRNNNSSNETVVIEGMNRNAAANSQPARAVQSAPRWEYH
jgi:hypothetical protein